MTPGAASLVFVAQSAAAGQRRFLWIGMIAAVSWVVVAAVFLARRHPRRGRQGFVAGQWSPWPGPPGLKSRRSR